MTKLHLNKKRRSIFETTEQVSVQGHTIDILHAHRGGRVVAESNCPGPCLKNFWHVWLGIVSELRIIGLL